MNFEEEVKDCRSHVRELSIQGSLIRIVTLEGTNIEAEMGNTGVIVTNCSIEIERVGFDDVNQLLNQVSPGYRDSFSQELMQKLINLS